HVEAGGRAARTRVAIERCRAERARPRIVEISSIAVHGGGHAADLLRAERARGYVEVLASRMPSLLGPSRFDHVDHLVRRVVVVGTVLIDLVDDETMRWAEPRFDRGADERGVEADRLAVLDKEVLGRFLAVR